jgi:hypothetical protein
MFNKNEEKMSLNTKSVSEAIRFTKLELSKDNNPDVLFYAPINFVRYAYDKSGIDFDESCPHNEFIPNIKALSEICEVKQREEIKLLLLEIISRSNQMKVEVMKGERKADPDLRPIKKDNEWGKLILDLTKAFGIYAFHEINLINEN